MSIVRVLLLLVPTALAACSPQRAARPVFPQPTENFLDEDAEEEQTPKRKKWFEHRHQAGPGVDRRARDRAKTDTQKQKSKPQNSSVIQC